MAKEVPDRIEDVRPGRSQRFARDIAGFLAIKDTVWSMALLASPPFILTLGANRLHENT